jgi:hypothetical protein
VSVGVEVSGWEGSWGVSVGVEISGISVSNDFQPANQSSSKPKFDEFSISSIQMSKLFSMKEMKSEDVVPFESRLGDRKPLILMMNCVFNGRSVRR